MMRKPILAIVIITAIFALLAVFSVIPNLKSPEWLYAYDAATSVTYMPVVCWMNQGYPPPHFNVPPVGGGDDWKGWKGGTFVPTLPLAQITSCSVGNCGDDLNNPAGMYIRVSWSGKALSSPHYIHLTNYANSTANRSGKIYENVGCYVSDTTVAGDWSCYDFVRFYYYFNFNANAGAATSVSQRAGLYDGNVTVTANPLNVDTTQSAIGAEDWKYHYSVSLNFLANQYDVNTGRYFSVSNITDTIIYAPDTDYDQWSAIPANWPTPGYNTVVMYYDHVSLGAGSHLPEYDSPSGMTVTTAYGSPSNPVAGALIQWLPYANATPEYPVTAYHIYRAMTPGATGGDPFESVAIVPADVTTYVDTNVLGGDTYCYKILPAIQGPNGAASIADERFLTVNASYHEALLNDPVAVVTQICGWVDVRPTSTNTPTPYLGTPTMTETVGGPTATETPVPSTTAGITDAHVYPNPFNPVAGTKKFYVGNVPPDPNDVTKASLKVSIYAMDGSLVKELTDAYYSSSRRRFEWDGKNQNGTKIVSGLYFVVLKSSGGGETRVERLLVCYKCDPVSAQ